MRTSVNTILISQCLGTRSPAKCIFMDYPVFKFVYNIFCSFFEIALTCNVVLKHTREGFSIWEYVLGKDRHRKPG